MTEENNRPRKFTPFKLFFYLSIAIVLPSLSILLNAFEDRQDIRLRAGQREEPQSQKIIFLEFGFDEDEQGDKRLKFDKPEVRNGYVYNEVMGTRILFTATLLDANQIPQATQRFSLPEYVAIDGLDMVSGREHGEMKRVESDEYAITLPFYESGRFLKIENTRGEIINLLALEDLPEINNLVAPRGKRGDEHEKEKKEEMKREREENRQEKKNEEEESRERDEKKNRRRLLDFLFKKIYAANGTFNIAIIGDNYGGDNIRFQSDVNDLAAGFISIEPFASNKDKIVFYSQLANTQICQPREAGWPSINCNDGLALQEASTLPYDKVYVLYNGNYTGYAYIGGVISYGTNSLDQNLAVKQGLFIHEMAGHSLGALMDEYSYGVSGFTYASNCSDSKSCPSWSTISGLGCFNICGYTNLYRATENDSVMNTSYFRGLLGFDSFSVQIVQGKLAEYFTILSPTVTIPTLTPVVTPTLTLTPTTPSLTPIPTATSIPSPTVVVCSIPNYCTAVKYCATDLQTEGSCGVTNRVCCRPQTEYKEEKTEEKMEVQRFEPLPTLPLPTPTIERFVSPSPTSTVVPTTTQTPTPTAYYLIQQNLRPSPTRVVPTQVQTTSLPPTLPPTREVFPSLTQTPTLVPELVFERATPTPVAEPSTGSVIKTSVSFIAALFKTLMSILFGQ